MVICALVRVCVIVIFSGQLPIDHFFVEIVGFFICSFRLWYSSSLFLAGFLTVQAAFESFIFYSHHLFCELTIDRYQWLFTGTWFREPSTPSRPPSICHCQYALYGQLFPRVKSFCIGFLASFVSGMTVIICC